MNFSEKVKKVKQLNEDTFLIRIESVRIASEAEPGQFVNIKCSNGLDAYLRRPISICSIHREQGTFDIVYQIRGKGTNLLCGLEAGDQVDVMGPLGQGFSINPEHRHIVVVGGGIGTFPLLQLLKEHPAKKKTAILGFRTKELVVLEDKFEKHCDELLIATDDGSYGHKGFVTALLEEKLKGEKTDMVYFCGPTIMMKLGVALLKEKGIPCEVSMEQRMGCGIGACLVCACKTKAGDEWEYSHVCKDGPVFNGDEVIFD
ncbi:MAG: dihydroorotate dehydrogenase electron transfer subunit [Clostridia bacterium]|nr:dihydroorotate dehydrogenase electron transfer subunit [Clostridia bacterium]